MNRPLEWSRLWRLRRFVNAHRITPVVIRQHQDGLHIGLWYAETPWDRWRRFESSTGVQRYLQAFGFRKFCVEAGVRHR